MSENNNENLEEKKFMVNVGGSVEKALVGDYKLNVMAILKEAYQLTQRSRVSINLGLLFCFMLGLFITLFSSQYLGGIEAVGEDQQASLLLNIIVTLVVYPFLVGVEMMGIYHAVGLKTKMGLVFSFLKRGSWVAICALITSSLISLGLAIILPAIYLAVALSLVLPLVVEKEYTPVKAIIISLKATRFQWFAMFQLHLIMLFGLFVTILPMAIINGSAPEIKIIGVVISLFLLSYLVPLYYNLKGILYREIFGLTIESSSQGPSKDDVFTA